jgi:aspartate aminotransferase
MKLSHRVMQITPSATMAVKRAADELKRRGMSVIDLGPGEPDFPTPEHIKRAAEEALAQNFTKYTAETGIWELRDTIAQKYNRDYGTHYTAENVLVTSGAKQALYNIAVALFEPGDEVLIPIPYWVSFPEQIKLVGAKPVFIHTAKNCSAERGARAKSISRRAREPSSSTSPNNPAGTVLEPKRSARDHRACSAPSALCDLRRMLREISLRGRARQRRGVRHRGRDRGQLGVEDLCDDGLARWAGL